ncbi:MAG: toluene tolerance protein [Proteobacteria bacterium]|nr:MAG: toluene tolerance protein [Pseudomonadota bacterium]
MKYLHRGLLIMMLSLLITPVWANTQVENLVVSVNSRIFAILQQRHAELKANPALISSFVQQEIIPFVDFTGMTKLTLGKHWKRASAEQRRRFLAAYKATLIRSYANAMLGFAGASIRVVRSVPSSRRGYLSVETIIQPVTAQAKHAKFDLRLKNNEWKAYNVSVDGVDLITNFRTNFTREITNTSLDALIRRLESEAA